MKHIPLIGRILYSLIFLMSGLGHFFDLTTMSQYTASKGVPLPEVAVIITGIMLLAGGLSVLLGYKVKIGTALLVIFLVPTSFIMHNFWAVEDAMQSQMQMILFMKNISMAGAALLIYHFGTGELSLEKG
ncbi:MAG: DoxX family protein [Calditrichaeota bacterium]|nr:DoxX family protein [Calditrichota bacterium]MCB0267735.1 DoxX family protein [Calditrichota bacterium]MCB0285005.1 DoxX family protein [Calditrichota bacterium]